MLAHYFPCIIWLIIYYPVFWRLMEDVNVKKRFLLSVHHCLSSLLESIGAHLGVDYVPNGDLGVHYCPSVDTRDTRYPKLIFKLFDRSFWNKMWWQQKQEVLHSSLIADRPDSAVWTVGVTQQSHCDSSEFLVIYLFYWQERERWHGPVRDASDAPHTEKKPSRAVKYKWTVTVWLCIWSIL